VGQIADEPDSLYKLTFPPVTGVSNARHASEIPRTDCANCHITSGRSGLPKLRQFVIASGVAPVHATLRAASATACAAPR
jgi:hypothetical protein